MKTKAFWLSALTCAALVIGAAVWLFPLGNDSADRPRAASPLEIRWHQGGIVLSGTVRDVATQQIIVKSATARLGGEADQLTDWMDIDPSAPPLADPAALASLIGRGMDGWHLQLSATDGWLAMPQPTGPASAEARELAQRAFGPARPIRLAPLR